MMTESKQIIKYRVLKIIRSLYFPFVNVNFIQIRIYYVYYSVHVKSSNNNISLQLYETALKVRSKDAHPIKFVGFDAKYGYSHKFICRAPEMPEIIR